MRIAFSDFGSVDFHVQSVDERPMGGTQSAASHLARSLARKGQEVFFFSKLSEPGVYDGVRCLSRSGVTADEIRSMGFDAFVCILNPMGGAGFRAVLGPRTPLIFWNHLPANQPVVQALNDARCRDAFDYMVMVSEWQRSECCQAFGIARERTVILRNGVSPVFERQAVDRSPVLARKIWPPVLAYTSAPYRGLKQLLDLFPAIRSEIAGTRLRVFSGMSLYQMGRVEDEASYGELYQRCRETEGVDYVGPIGQRELAEAMRAVTMLAYPNTFPEASCIAVLEAMASGCRVVTTGWGRYPRPREGLASLWIMMRMTRNLRTGLQRRL